MVFTGKPGTGKTTVARILLRIYAALRLLKQNDIFVEVSRNHLVGEYLGQTAPKTTDVVNSALGGILFIDEAYSLLERKDDSYGKEAIDTLVPLIENNRQNLVVILAGYTKEMEYFMDSNPGLRSRIPKKIVFEDYTLKELVKIFKNQIKHENYKIKFKDSILERVLTIKSSQSDFGNARGIRNCVDQVISNQNVRIMDNIASLKESEYLNITDEDIQSIL